MCGRFVQVDGVWMRLEEWMRERVLDQRAREVPNPYNVAPTSAVQAVVPAGAPVVDAPDVARDALVLVTSRWGFDVGAKTVINTRIETAAESRLWRAPLEHGRAVVVANGFYEWGEAGRPRYITTGGAIAMAAVLALRGDGEPWQRRRMSIVTCGADEDMAPVHDRMPVLLGPDEVRPWLLGTTEEALEVARPWGRGLDMREVGPEVGKVSAQGEGLIAPVKSRQERLF